MTGESDSTAHPRPSFAPGLSWPLPKGTRRLPWPGRTHKRICIFLVPSFRGFSIVQTVTDSLGDALALIGVALQ